MFKKNRLSLGSATGPVFFGTVLLLAVLLLMAFTDRAHAANPRTVLDVDGEVNDSTLVNGSYVGDGTVVNITATYSLSTTPTKGDKVDINIEVDHPSGGSLLQTIALNYTGTGTDFSGNITVDSSLSSDFDWVTSGDIGIKVKVEEGSNITVRNASDNALVLYYFLADVEGPSLSINPTTDSNHTHFEGYDYCDGSAQFNLTISDSSTSLSWFRSGSNTTYRWDGGAWKNWSGSAIPNPGTSGMHELEVKAKDRFDQETSDSVTYNVATFIIDTVIDSERTPFREDLIFISNVTIDEEGKLTLDNTTVVFTGHGSYLKVKTGGELEVYGMTPGAPPVYLSRFTSVSRDYTIISERGSVVSFTHTKFQGENTTGSEEPVLNLSAGTLDKCRFEDIRQPLMITGGDVEITGSKLEFDSVKDAVKVDLDHRIGPETVVLNEVDITGTYRTGIDIQEASVWTPNDLAGKNIYYGEGGNFNYIFNISSQGYSYPYEGVYLKVPNFVNSQDGGSSFKIMLNDGSSIWYEFPGFSPKSNHKDSNWTNGNEQVLDLGILDTSSVINITWNASEGDRSCAYLGEPRIGKTGSFEKDVISSSNDWRKVNINSVNITSVSLIDATNRFIDVDKSGRVVISDLSLGKGLISYSCSDLAHFSDSSIRLTGSTINGLDASTGIRTTFSPVGDWGRITIDGTTFTGFNSTDGAAINSTGGWLDLRGVYINETIDGVVSDGSMVYMDGVVLNATRYGADIEVPDHYSWPEANLMFKGITSWDFERSALMLSGNPSYDLDISIDKLMAKRSSGVVLPSLSRADELGAITLDFPSTRSVNLSLGSTSSIEGTAGAGIAVRSWSDEGSIDIEATHIDSMGLDGVCIADRTELSVKSSQIMKCGGYGIYGSDDVRISINRTTRVDQNLMGGIWTGEGSWLDLRDSTVTSNGGAGVTVGDNSEVYSERMVVTNNKAGFSLYGSTLTAISTDVEFNQGNGINAVDCEMHLLGTPGRYSRVQNNDAYGLHMEGGELEARNIDFSFNGNDGARLKDVELDLFRSIYMDGNDGAGARFDLSSPAVLSGIYYGHLEEIESYRNGLYGIWLTYDSNTLSQEVRVNLSGFYAHSNGFSELMSPKEITVHWTADQDDQVGSSNRMGKIYARMDLHVKSDNVKLQNLNISLLGQRNGIYVTKGNSLNLSNCFIRPQQPANGFLIEMEGGRLSTYGGMMTLLSHMEIMEADLLEMKGTLIDRGGSGVMIMGSNYTINGCSFEDFDGPALTIEDGSGTISGTTFTGNTIGLKVNGLEEDLRVMDSSFTGNSWGVYLFNGDTMNLNITGSTFSDNDPYSVYAKRGVVRITDSTVDPGKFTVDGLQGSIIVEYTLTVRVVNEDGDEVPYNLTVTRIGGAPEVETHVVDGQEPVFEKTFIAYVKDSTKLRDITGVDLAMTYSEGEDQRSIILNRRTEVVFDGYQAPVPLQQVFLLSGIEDMGLDTDDGTVDVSGWFEDLGEDQEQLTFSTEKITQEITPHISGSTLWLEFDENWYGTGDLTLVARDPHGKEGRATVRVTVAPKNDLPVASNPRITPINPRTGDTIRALWEWSDVDTGDIQPTLYNIKWYLNGNEYPLSEGERSIQNVQYGEIWQFRITPADNKSWVTGKFGTPVTSPTVMVGNMAPTFEGGVTITTRYPTTETDIIAVPGEWSDPESEAVSYHYQWEVLSLNGEDWTPLGVPDSPILSHQFTKKGDSIRVKAWVSDGIANSPIRIDEVRIYNTDPKILSAEISPEVIDETVTTIRVVHTEVYDADGDRVDLEYFWQVGGTTISISDEYSELSRNLGNWNYPEPSNITVFITPVDESGDAGNTLSLTVYVTPRDTDGDGKFDDANGDGRNNGEDDTDDDNDGYLDEWENVMGTNPKNPLSMPLDTDRDGWPDGDATNSRNEWMDEDDDNDGVLDENDDFPKDPTEVRDTDGDGVGDVKDDDIDGDGVPNFRDYDPYDRNVSKEPEETDIPWLSIFILVLLILVILVVGAIAYLVYTGKVELPTSAPPPIREEEASEAIFDDEEEERPRRAPPVLDIDEDELEDMKVCSNCGELVSSDVEKCPNCGAYFDDIEE